MPEKQKSNHFGQYLRTTRVAASLSLRAVADAIGISHVYLGEVERGVRGPLRPEHWPALMRAIPAMRRDELDRHAQLSRPLQLDVADAPPRYQNLAMALARRLRKRDLTEAEIAKLFKVLKGAEERR